MKLNEWKQNELNRLLMEKFDLKEKDELDEMHGGGCGCPDKHPDMSPDAYVIKLKESPEDEEELEEGHNCADHPGRSHEQWLEGQSK